MWIKEVPSRGKTARRFSVSSEHDTLKVGPTVTDNRRVA